MKCVFFSVLCLLFFNQAYAQQMQLKEPNLKGIYKWTDENGDVHYSQHPPGGASQFTKIKTDESSASQDEKEVPELGIPSGETPVDSGPSSGQAQSDNEAAIRRNCHIARKNKALLEIQGIDVNFQNDKKETVTLSAQQRQEYLKQADLNIQKYCK